MRCLSVREACGTGTMAVVERPTTRFVGSGDALIAFQAFGAGPDLVVISAGPSHLELRWHMPASARFYRKLSDFCRVITFDRRGIGLSSRSRPLASFEDQVGDVSAVMDAVGSESAFLYGALDGGALALLFAAAHPDRTLGLIVDSCAPRLLVAPDYEFGFEPEQWERLAAMVEDWSLGEFIRWVAPEADSDEEARDTLIRYAAAGAGPAGLAAVMRLAAGIDLREAASTLRVPTAVLAGQDYTFGRVEAVRSLADRIEGSRFVVLPPSNSIDERFAAVLDEIQYSIVGSRRVSDSDRILATLLFVDVVGSTERVTELGDAHWRRVLDLHDDAVRRLATEFGGRVIKATGDGALVSFDRPASAIRAALRIQLALREIGLAVRAGIHAGEVERRGDDVAGLCVHIAARVADAAPSGEILVTRTVADLVAGRGMAFEDRGVHRLRGVAGDWQLMTVLSGYGPVV